MMAALTWIPLAFLGYWMCPLKIISPIGISMTPSMAPRGELFLMDPFFFRWLDSDSHDIISVGDIVMTRKPSSSSSSPSSPSSIVGSILSHFRFPDSHPRVMKRVMAINRNTNNNNNKYNANEIPSKTKLPNNSVWMEGDNREWSTDSRDYGPIQMDHIEAKLIMRIWPLTKFGRLSPFPP